MDGTGFCSLFGILVVESRVFNFCRGGRPGYLANFPQKVPPKINLNWVHGFHRVLEPILDCCLLNYLVASLRGGGQGKLENFPKMCQNKSDLNWVPWSQRILEAVSGFACEMTFLHLWRGARVLGWVSQKSKKNSNLNWVHWLFKDFEVVGCSFGNLLMELYVWRFGRGELRVLSKLPPNKLKHNIWIGTWMSKGFGGCFGILLMT